MPHTRALDKLSDLRFWPQLIEKTSAEQRSHLPIVRSLTEGARFQHSTKAQRLWCSPALTPGSHCWTEVNTKLQLWLQPGTARPSCARCAQPRPTYTDPKEVTAALPRALKVNHVTRARMWTYSRARICSQLLLGILSKLLSLPDHREIPCGHLQHPWYGCSPGTTVILMLPESCHFLSVIRSFTNKIELAALYQSHDHDIKAFQGVSLHPFNTL